MDRRKFICLTSGGSLVLPDVLRGASAQPAPGGPVDCNVMLGPSNRIPNAYEKVEDVIAEMDYYGVEQIVAYHSYSRFVDAAQGNELISGIARQFPRVRPCWVIYPSPAELPRPEEFVAKMRAEGVRALRIFPGQRDPNTFGLPVQSWSFGPLFSALERHQVPLFVERPLLEWKEIYEIAVRFKRLPLVLLMAHFGESRNIYALLESCPNLHFGITYFLLFNGLDDLVRRFGAERFLFDSGLPERDPSMVLPIIYFSRIREQEKQLILRRNLERLWGSAYGG